MRISIGSQKFEDVKIPLLWGTRAILQDRKGRLSVIDLSGERARLEILGDEPAPRVKYSPRRDGFVILQSRGVELYLYERSKHRLSSSVLNLPDCEVTRDSIKIGGSLFSGNVVAGFGVGLAVSEEGVVMGAPMPPNLAELVIDLNSSIHG